MQLHVSALIVGIVVVVGCGIGVWLLLRSAAWKREGGRRFNSPVQGFVSLAIFIGCCGLILIGASIWGL